MTEEDYGNWNDPIGASTICTLTLMMEKMKLFLSLELLQFVAFLLLDVFLVLCL